MNRARPYRWLAALPAAGLLIGVPFANRVHAYVLGLPFLLFWIVAWVLLTSALLACVEALDRRHDAARSHDPDPGGDDHGAGRR